MTFSERMHEIQSRVEAARARSFVSAPSIRIIGVTKTVEADAISALLDAGCHHFGENRWQHARDMLSAERATEATWHFIGRLQSNKVKPIVRHFDWIHSIENESLAQAISEESVKIGKVMRALIQVNVSGEESKQGVSPDEALLLVEKLRELPGIVPVGFMTMAPLGATVSELHQVFARLRGLRDETLRMGLEDCCELSMGMSEDYETAVEEGATLIRIGRLLMHGNPDSTER